jgi:hypothetical protein
MACVIMSGDSQSAQTPQTTGRVEEVAGIGHDKQRCIGWLQRMVLHVVPGCLSVCKACGAQPIDRSNDRRGRNWLDRTPPRVRKYQQLHRVFTSRLLCRDICRWALKAAGRVFLRHMLSAASKTIRSPGMQCKICQPSGQTQQGSTCPCCCYCCNFCCCRLT